MFLARKQAGTALAPSSRLKKLWAALAREESGNVSVSFGLIAIVMFTMVGGALDLGRWLNARDQTMGAIDAAVLAAGRALQTGSSAAEAIAVAQRYYAANTQSRLPVSKDTITFTVSSDRMTVTTVGEVEIKTPIFGLADWANVGLNKLPLFRADEAPQATVATEESLNTNREVALMLDVSGSMCQPCTKLTDMKAAAADLINILIKDSPQQYWTKVAVVPFSGDVRPPSTVYTAVTPDTGSDGQDHPSCGTGWPSGSRCIYTGGTRRGVPRSTDYNRTVCVGERAGAQKYSDATASTTTNFVTPTYNSSGNCSTPSSGTVLPLSSTKSTVLSKVNGLTTGGGTAGHVGTAWSYYMLSPNWAGVLPAANQPQAYGTSQLKKIAILMTDGEYNYTYDSNGVAVYDDYGGSSVNGESSAAQAVQICQQMKDDDIEIYTVGFELDGNQTAINTLHDCATDPDKAYLASNGEALKQVFRDIAVRITELHLLR